MKRITIIFALLFCGAVVVLSFFTPHRAGATPFKNLRSHVREGYQSSDIFKIFCEKNHHLCHEINTLGFHRHDLVSELGTSLYRGILGNLVESLFEFYKSNTNNENVRGVALPSIFNKLVTGKQDEDAKWADTVTGSDIQELRRLISSSPDPYPYFGFVPYFLGKVRAASSLSTGATKCSSNVEVSVGAFPDVSSTKTVSVTVNTTMKSDRPLFCTDYWLFSSGPSKIDASVVETGVQTFLLNVTDSLVDPALVFDLNTNGVRVFRNIKNQLERDLDTIDTLLLFKPMIMGKLDPESAQRNINFLNEYSKMIPFSTERNFKGVLHGLNLRTDIRSGDMFAKMELDGLGPAENLGQGTTAGHHATALWSEDGSTLFVCESIIKGVSCTPYPEWIEALQNSGMMVVLVPLDPAYSKTYNVTAAWQWVNKTLGNAYGYPNFLFGWIDTVAANYPCFPSADADDNFKRCLSADSLELFAFHLNQILPGVIDFFLGQALNHRAGTFQPDGTYRSFPQVLEAGYKNKNMTFGQLMTVPEQDRWLYNTTKSGETGHHLLPAQVCSTLGCNIFRAAGGMKEIEGDVQCSEVDCWDIFSLNIFDKNRIGANRPQVCQQADPANVLCQLCGNYTFNLIEDFNSRQMWKNMNNDCATQNPYPYKRNGCYQN